jgi:hypothetical protein
MDYFILFFVMSLTGKLDILMYFVFKNVIWWKRNKMSNLPVNDITKNNIK